MPARIDNTDRPNILIRFKGETDEKRQLNLRDRLTEFKYEDKEKGADICELTFDNFDLTLYDEPGLDKGSILEVIWGYPSNFSPAREVIIKKSSGFTTLKVEAYGLEVQLNKETKTRTFEKKKRSQVAQIIAQAAGFPSDKQDIEDSGEVLEHIHQAKLTDAQFMMKLAEQEGFQFYIDADGFHFHSRRLGQRPTRSYRYYHDQEGGDIVSIDDVETNIAARAGAMRMKGRDTKRKKNIDVRATNATTERDSLANVIEIVDPESGKTRIVRRNASEQIQSTGQQSEAAAKREAEARYRATQLANVKLKFTAIGDPSALAKSIVLLVGIHKLLSGPYYVTKAIHTISQNGYRVQFECKRDGVSERGAESGGDKNKEKPDGNDVQLFEKVDPETGKTQLQFRDSRGRTIGVGGRQKK